MQLLGLDIPVSRRALLPTASVMLLLTLIMLLPEAIRDELKLDRQSALRGEQLWQLITGQLVHHSWPHLGLNLLGLLVCWALFIDHQQGWRRWLGVPLIMLSSSAAQLYFDPQVRFYAGFSGTLYGIFAYCALADVLHKRWLGALVLLGLAGKVIYDLLYLPDFSGLAFAAHTGGVVAGLILAFLCKILTLNHG
ncbi:rhombosortase [Pseudidiomarina insulisalsae]|uniref:Rhombosortase n=1 Tax=Pseudidiomarina insulisalsae TaxID=575789 RepID=A0A432YNJ6_9GAMM|nr:rhombosortase [Pseudidiomarina insulisalsae]RUO62520.1 rhombosortase [Pseudidiomarina insulisalsae]